MHIDPVLLSALSALVGALTGGNASLLAAIYTQRHQDRLPHSALLLQRRMSASGPKQTSPVEPHMSAFGGKADVALQLFLTRSGHAPASCAATPTAGPV